MRRFLTGLALALGLMVGAAASADDQVDLLVAEGDDGGFGYNYGGSTWADMTDAIDAATNSVSLTPNLDDLDFMLQFGALWVDQRWLEGLLSQTEIDNITAYAATGRRVVMIGENESWFDWNNQITGIGGGSYDGGSVSGAVNTVFGHELTRGVNIINTLSDGVAVGGTALFDQNVATLWGSDLNVLSVLSINAQGEAWGDFDNAVFFTNVANWVGKAVPAPGAAVLLCLAGLAPRRRR